MHPWLSTTTAKVAVEQGTSYPKKPVYFVILPTSEDRAKWEVFTKSSKKGTLYRLNPRVTIHDKDGKLRDLNVEEKLTFTSSEQKPLTIKLYKVKPGTTCTFCNQY